MPRRRRLERAAALLALGLVLFNPPLMTLFAGPTTLAGLPLIGVYLFLAWAVLILLAARAGRRPPE